MADCLPLPPSIATAVGTFGNASERLAEQPGILIGTRVPVLAGTQHRRMAVRNSRGKKSIFVWAAHDAPSRISQLAFTERVGPQNATADMER